MTKIDPLGQLKALVEERCRNGRFYPYSAWGHCLDTAEIAESLAERVGADGQICWLGGLLHDIGAIEQGTNNHHKIGAEIAGEILKNFSFPEDTIRAVQHCIFAHRGSLSITRETVEAEIVASADAISHFKRVDELMEIALGKLGKNPEEAKEWVREKIERGWDKLMPEAKDMAQAAYGTALKALAAKD